MKSTGRRVYLSGAVRLDTAEKVLDAGPLGRAAFESILVDERRGYAYKVTFASTYPNVTNPNRFQPGGFGIYSFSRRELLRMSDDQAKQYLGFTKELSQQNRNIAIVGMPHMKALNDNNFQPNYQNQYVIKGDAMVTQSLSIGWYCDSDEIASEQTNYYIELEEFEVSSDEEILLILSERGQDAQGIVE